MSRRRPRITVLARLHGGPKDGVHQTVEIRDDSPPDRLIFTLFEDQQLIRATYALEATSYEAADYRLTSIEDVAPG